MSNSNKPSIDDHIEQLRKDKSPDRDLWAGIEYSINESTTQKDETGFGKRLIQKPLYAIAASVLVAVVVGYVSFQSGRLESGQELVLTMSQEHSSQKNALLTSLEGQPTTTVNWQEQLEELDQAANAIKKALDNEPNNAALLKMLQKVYQQQITLIERVHAPAWQQI